MQDSLGAVPEPASTISLREYGDVLRRRRAIILQTFVIVLVAGVLVSIFQQPVYRSTARLLLEAPSYTINSVSTSDPLGDLFRVNNQYSVGTQVELLQTGKIRKEVADKLGTPALPTMTVAGVEGTQIIEVASEGDVPELVAAAPNTLLDIYVDESAGNSTKELDGAIKFTTEQGTAAYNTLTEAEIQLRNFKTTNRLADIVKSRDEQLKHVSELNNLAFTIESDLRSNQVKADATRRQMEEAGKTRSDLLSPLADPTIQNIDNQLANLEIERQTLALDVTPQNKAYTRLLTTRAQLQKRRAELLSQLDARNRRLNPLYQQFGDQLRGYAIDASVLSARAADYSKQAQEAQTRLASFPTFEAKNAQLERKFGDAQKSYDMFKGKLNELQLRKQTKRKMASVMQRAEVPSSPIRPKKAQQIVIAGLLGLVFGLCLALLQELFDDRINSPEEAERVLRLPSLGHIPMIEEEGLRLIRDISTFSPLMEAYRSLRTNINFAAVGSPMKSVVVTSSVPAEGKSTTAANLAMAMALDNKRVILVDADLRRPSMHKLFRIESSPGLTDILVGTHTLDETIRDTTVPNVRIIPAGSPPPNPAELLGSAAMGHLLATLETMADVVLFDSPPALAVADAVVLASRTNGVLLVVGYGETKKTNTKKAIDILSRGNANVLGTVLNRMDGPSSGYYYGKYYVPATDRSVSATKNGNDNGVAAGATNRALTEGDASDTAGATKDNDDK